MAKLKLSALGSNVKTSTQPNPEAVASSPKKETKASKPHFGWEYLSQFIAQNKIDVLNHKAQDTLWIGSKEGGKSRPVICGGIAMWESDYRAMGLGLKKYKTNATERMHQMVQNMALEIKYAGFNIPDYEKGQNQSYRMTKSVKTDNQQIEYAGFDDYNALAGIEAKNLGYFPYVIIEEPVMLDDEGNIPSPQEWEAQISTIKDSVARSNSRHMSIFNREVPPTKYHYTMNPWDDHPLIVYAESVFPEEKFLEWAIKDLLNNTMMTYYDEPKDTLIVRNTKFDNPKIRVVEKTLAHFKITTMAEWIAFDKTKIDFEDEAFASVQIKDFHFVDHLKKYKGALYPQAMDALAANDRLKMTQILGLKYENEGKNKKTYNLNKLPITNVDDFKYNGKFSPLYMALDIDHRRQFVLSSGFSVIHEQKAGATPVCNIIVRPQQSLPVDGVGDSGELIDHYAQIMVKKMQEELSWYIKTTGKYVRPIIAVDDNYRHYINIFKKLMPEASFALAQKHGSWEIIPRTTWFQTAIDSGFIIMSDKNIKLISNLKKSQIKEGSEKRDESGAREKDYDEINSLEYMLYYFRHIIYGKYKAGIPENYL